MRILKHAITAFPVALLLFFLFDIIQFGGFSIFGGQLFTQVGFITTYVLVFFEMEYLAL